MGTCFKDIFIKIFEKCQKMSQKCEPFSYELCFEIWGPTRSPYVPEASPVTSLNLVCLHDDGPRAVTCPHAHVYSDLFSFKGLRNLFTKVALALARTSMPNRTDLPFVDFNDCVSVHEGGAMYICIYIYIYLHMYRYSHPLGGREFG